MEISPAVERAWESAQTTARKELRTNANLVDLLLGLLQEDEGRPAEVLERAGISLLHAREVLANHRDRSPHAPTFPELIQLASEYGVALSGDPSPTSEFVLLAALGWDSIFADILTQSGLSRDAIAQILNSQSTIERSGDQPAFVVPDPIEMASASRILDVNFNRACESLRILDDYCRLILNDQFLTQSHKDLRHELVRAAKELPPGDRIAARDAQSDVGTTVESHGEYTRHTPHDVATVNARRLQEALRSLEEYGKVVSVPFAKAIERIRYKTYSLERAVLVGSSARDRLSRANLYLLLTGSQCEASLDWTIAESAAGGVDIVQMREKNLTDRELLDRAKKMRRWTRDAGVLFIVNDRPDIARAVEADGVHLGQDDLSVNVARKIVGPKSLVGVSTHNLGQLRQAILDGADYVGIGPVFHSSTKDFDALAGQDYVREASAETSLPAFALGGIRADNLQLVIDAGAVRVAVSGAIARSDDPRSAAALFKAILNHD